MCWSRGRPFQADGPSGGQDLETKQTNHKSKINKTRVVSCLISLFGDASIKEMRGNVSVGQISQKAV